MQNRSSARWAMRAPDARSSADTPNRPPMRTSIAARRSAAALASAGEAIRLAALARTVRRVADWNMLTLRGARGALLRRRNEHAGVGIFLQLIPQGTDGDAKDRRGVGAVAEAVAERVDDQLLLDRRHRLADEGARDG